MDTLRDLAELARTRDFRWLFAVRLASQSGDGAFQVGLAALFFFSPESQGTAGSIAVAFAVLLAPFTIVGPWAGVLLDRWRRRQVLVVANLVRLVVTLALVVAVLAEGLTTVVYVLALLALSVNRFLLAALSASLPHVVPGRLLLTANSLVPTLGAAAAGAGALVGLVLAVVLPVGAGRDAAALGCAAVLFTIAGLVPLGLGRDQLGPDQLPDDGGARPRRALARLGAELADGVRELVGLRTPALALLLMGLHRLLYGVMFVASILLARNTLTAPAGVLVGGQGNGQGGDGLALFTWVLAASGVGFGLAVILTSTLGRRTGPARWIAAALLLGAVAQIVLAVHVSWVTVLAAAVALGLAVQGAKIAVDTIVHRSTPDAVRGRAFALYDVIYNAAFIGAACLAALVLPDSGSSAGVFAVLAAAYAGLALLAWRSRGVLLGDTAVQPASTGSRRAVGESGSTV